MPKEVYQVEKLRELTLLELNRLVDEINQHFFEISKRLANLQIPNSSIESATTVANLVTALIAAGIGEES